MHLKLQIGDQYTLLLRTFFEPGTAFFASTDNITILFLIKGLSKILYKLYDQVIKNTTPIQFAWSIPWC